MKRLPQFLVALATAICLAGCSNEPTEQSENLSDTSEVMASETQPDSTVEPKQGEDTVAAGARFELTKAGDEANPKSIVKVVFNGKTTDLKEIAGEAERYAAADFEEHKIPKEATDACGAWWAGQGVYFYALPTDKGVDIFEGWQDEEAPGKEGYHWKKVKSLE
jgi:hypothetical protein